MNYEAAQSNSFSTGQVFDDAFGGHAVVQRALGAVAQEVQLSRRVRVRVDGEVAADLHRQLEQSRRWVAALRAGVDLDRRAVIAAGR